MQENPIFDKFYTEEEAAVYEQLFSAGGLHPSITKPKAFFDVAIGVNPNPATLFYTLHLPAAEFAQADEIIFDEVKSKGIPNDYHLYDLTQQELEEVISKPDQWSKQDIAAARIILQEKGQEIAYETIVQKAEERYQELKQVSFTFPVVLILFCLCTIGYFYTLIIGPMLYFMKSTDFNGKKQYYFSERTRQQGILLFLANLAGIAFWLFVW